MTSDTPSVSRATSRQIVASGRGPYLAIGSGLMAAQVHDEIVRQYGIRVYELMNLDDACSAALWFLKAGALSDGVQLAPAFSVPAGTEVTDPEILRKLELANEIYESCQRVMTALADTIHATLMELLDGLYLGCKAAEMVFELTKEGPDANRQVPTVFQCVPNWAWNFRCDTKLRVQKIRCWTDEGWRDVEREHFAIFTWRPADGDPRGSSIYRPAYRPFERKWAADPSYRKYLDKFGVPSIVLKAGPNAEPEVTVDPLTGVERVRSPQEVLRDAGLAFQNCSILALPNGTEAEILQPPGTGEVFDKLFDRSDREIFRSVIFATRPMQEAKHGSKADTETGMDVFKFGVGQVRKPLVRAFRRDFLGQYVALNWGPAIARELTPLVAFGASEDVSPDLMKAFADAWSKGIFEEAQKPWIWTKVSAPTPSGWKPKKDDPERTGTKDTDGDGNPDKTDPSPRGNVTEEDDPDGFDDEE